MKILMQNYDNFKSNESSYLSHSINLLNRGFTSTLWHIRSSSVFDTLDAYNPDILVYDFKYITEDLVKYLDVNREKNIKVIFNISGLTDKVKEIEQFLEKYNLNCLFLYCNDYQFLQTQTPKNNKFVRILPAANIQNPNINVLDYKINDAVVCFEHSKFFDDICSQKTHFHKIKIGEEYDSNFDFTTNIEILSSIYNKYNEVTLVGGINDVCGQVFFDTLIRADKTSVKTEDQESFNKFLQEIFDENYFNPEKENLLDSIKKQVLENHTSVNRANQLLNEIEACLK